MSKRSLRLLGELVQSQTAYLRTGSLQPSNPVIQAVCNYSVFRKLEEKVKEATQAAAGTVKDSVNPDDLKEKLKETSSFASGMFKGALNELRGSGTASTSSRVDGGGSSEKQTEKETGAENSQSRPEEGTSRGPSSADKGTTYDTGKRQPLTLAARLSGLAQSVAREFKEAVLPREESDRSTLQAHRRDEASAAASQVGGDVMVVQVKRTRWQEMADRVREAAAGNPLLKRFGQVNNPVLQKASEKIRDVKETLQEKWETSDSPLVHRIEHLSSTVFQENEYGQAMREIRARDPNFEMVAFLKGVQRDVPKIIGAYLKGDVEALQQFCSPEMVERLSGIIEVLKKEGQTPDATILHTSDVQLMEVKFMDSEPICVVSFACQQINCVRDSFGNVVEGKADEIHQVHYAWALQQEVHGSPDPITGAWRPPRWQLREMLIRGSVPLL